MSRRGDKSPGGECGTDGNGSIVFPSTNSQLQHQPHHRITKPPGGETSDIFTTTPTSTPPTTPRKVKNYMASTIFTPETAAAADQHKIRHRPDDGSFNRLFGASDSAQTSPHHQANGHGDATDGQVTPRGKNHQKSNVLFAETNGKANGQANGHGNGVGNGHGNGVGNGHGNGVGNGHGNGVGNGHGNGVGNGHGNGQLENGGSSGSSSGSATPVGNGHANGKSNGHSNGGSHDGSPNGGTPGKRIPPGGFSSKLW